MQTAYLSLRRQRNFTDEVADIPLDWEGGLAQSYAVNLPSPPPKKYDVIIRRVVWMLYGFIFAGAGKRGVCLTSKRRRDRQGRDQNKTSAVIKQETVQYTRVR